MRMQNCLYVLILSAAWVATEAADVTQIVEHAKHCLPLWSIDNIRVLDEQNIAFRMKNDDYYLNRLPNPCHNLDDNRAIMYSTPLASLCNLDIITVLDPVGGGFQNMGSCGLGEFQPVSESEIRQLKEK